ncbi:MAG: MotA/TolQ/ExbB proton channel family protein [Endomicrobiia bacterium]|nr:MotA/TolQ/ExbB proton channel family protein [Endomicrobiia bacterium]
MFDYIFKGGFMMVPLIASSVIALAIIIDRLIFFHRISDDERLLMAQLTKEIKNGNYDGAISVCSRHPSPVANILAAAIRKFAHSRQDIESAIEKEAVNEIPKVERYIPGLAVIASVSTLMGFTGTVTGMIRAFGDIASRGVSSPAVVASGISEALITTATGLIIAIPTMLFYHYFTYRVSRLTLEVEKCTNELLEIKPK